MKQITILITFFSFFLISSCEKLDVPSETPTCIKRKIRQFKSRKVRNPPASVWKYEYNGQSVYYIPPYCCDAQSELYDADCNLICHPDGGYSGGGDEKCTDFFGKRTNEQLIWKDDRE